MSLRRVWILFVNEMRQGLKSFMFLLAIVMPVVMTLLVLLVFGDALAQTPRLGVYDPDGSSAFVAVLVDDRGIETTMFGSSAALRAAVERGQVELGLDLPPGFDGALHRGDRVNLNVYRWGEQGVNSAFVLDTALVRAVTKAQNISLPVSIHSIQLGNASTASWAQRLLPLMLFMAVMLGGLLIPAASLIEEKQRHTLVALIATPTSLLDVYLAKIAAGFVVSTAMGVAILALNKALGNEPVLLLLIVAMGGLLSAVIGIILGSFSRNMETFLGLIKALGTLIFAPAILPIFPKIPEWIGQLFPTYYVVNPLLEVSQKGAGLSAVAGQLVILAVIIAVLIFALSRVIQRQRQELAMA